VWSSPLRRALETAQLAGFDPRPLAELEEWDYGEYEGLTSEQIDERRPAGTSGATVSGREDAARVGARADAVISALPPEGDVLVFSHGTCCAC